MKVVPASDSRGSLIGCAVRLMVTPGASIRGSTGSRTLSLGEAQADADRHSSRAKTVVPNRFMFRVLWRSFSPLGERLLLKLVDGKGFSVSPFVSNPSDRGLPTGRDVVPKRNVTRCNHPCRDSSMPAHSVVSAGPK
jgi:hypothetical protein